MLHLINVPKGSGMKKLRPLDARTRSGCAGNPVLDRYVLENAPTGSHAAADPMGHPPGGDRDPDSDPAYERSALPNPDCPNPSRASAHRSGGGLDLSPTSLSVGSIGLSCDFGSRGCEPEFASRMHLRIPRELPYPPGIRDQQGKGHGGEGREPKR